MNDRTMQEQRIWEVCNQLLQVQRRRTESDYKHLLDPEYVEGTHMSQEEAKDQFNSMIDYHFPDHEPEYYMGGILETYYANARINEADRESLLAAATYAVLSGVCNFQITRSDVVEHFDVSPSTISRHWVDMLDDMMLDEDKRAEMVAIVEGARSRGKGSLEEFEITHQE